MKSWQARERQAQAIASLYEDPFSDNWTDVLVRASVAALDAHGAALFDVDQGGTIDAAISSTLSTPAQEHAYRTYYSALNPVMPLAAPVMQLGVIADRTQFVADRDYRRCEFYTDYVSAQGYFHEMGTTIENRFGRTLQVFVARAPSQRPFGEAQRVRLAELGAHARNLHRVRSLIPGVLAEGVSTSQRPGTNKAFLSLDASQRVIHEIGPLLDDLYRHGGLRREGPLLRFGDARTQRAFERAASHFRSGGLCAPAIQLRVQGATYTLEVFALRGVVGGERARIGLVISGTSERQRARPLPRKAHELTRAEDSLVSALVDGETLASYAARTDRSVNTVRSQLKSVYRKLGVNRQHQLVARHRSRSG